MSTEQSETLPLRERQSPLRRLRHPIRALVFLFAAYAVSFSYASALGVTSACAGAVSGLVAAELLARSRFRALVAVAFFVGISTAVTVGSAALANSTFAPEALGHRSVLELREAAQFFFTFFGVVGSMRLIAVRKPDFLFLEVLYVALALSLALEAHRDGMIARPLWLSDFAWQRNLDPAHLLFWPL